ncbi:methyltransferase domain-containing protein [Streptomyces sp. SID8366]|uniref:class I SAM-dependent methyltransferase n=1 Tax=unclassified Streptomyces TaxID=2593676 RepID=UPI000DB9C195|nr:class I SAM-dependent methyltransferase [Streptomyces sp. PsTaAH-130]MYU02628.1 methyltransferase domain-containing protein [Streptomyces sp. SID8366]MYU64743.1 methyltransferase domain-containing protein [Streptomyces sp. SID69]
MAGTVTHPDLSLSPDGSPVEFYARLPAGSSPRLIHASIPAGASILELGSGAGRITHPLLELGHEVVAVDESPAMLAHIKGAETIESRIEDLKLARRFDVVLLMSHLIEKPDIEQARAFLRVCRAHVENRGHVLIQRDPPERRYVDEPPFAREVAEGCTISMRELSQASSELLSFTLDYEIDGSKWTQSVVTRPVDDRSLAYELGLADLEIDRFLNPSRSWVSARPSQLSPR